MTSPVLRPIAALLLLAIAASSIPVTGLAQADPAAPAAPRDWRAQGPRSLVLSYKVAPASRLDFRAAVKATTLPRLQKLKASGALEAFHVLANRYLDGPWDLMLVLDFRRAADLARWREVEAQAPGGLDAPALQLVSAAETAPSDRMRAADRSPTPGRRPVYLVVPYEYHVSTDDYLTYVDGYVLPQLDGWMQDGALVGYDLYFARYYAGRPWSSLLVLAYDGEEGLASRDAVVKAVRSRLAAQPEWKSFADAKQSVRVEKEAVVADDLASIGPEASK